MSKYLDISELTFSGENGRDEFLREKVADQVISLLTSDIDISPMVIDGDWGTGKTEFCFKLVNKFKAEHANYRLIYIDAFKADHADNPLMTVLASILNKLPKDEKYKTLISKAIPVIRYGLKTVAKAASNHVLRQNVDVVGEELKDFLEDTANDVIDATVKAMLKDHQEAEASLKSLQDLLREIVIETPMVLFVDELDRCRPDFSVYMLEVIKHTFGIDGLKFVLISNTEQLKAAINHNYGSNVNAQRYLDKFLKFSFQLPDIVLDRSSQRLTNQTKNSVKYLEHLMSKNNSLNFICSNEDRNYIVTSMVKNNNLTLREVESFVRYLSIYSRLDNGFFRSGDIEFIIRVLGVFLFCFKGVLINEIKIKDTLNLEVFLVLMPSLLRKIEGLGSANNNFIDEFAISWALELGLVDKTRMNKTLVDKYDSFYSRFYRDSDVDEKEFINILLKTEQVLRLTGNQ